MKRLFILLTAFIPAVSDAQETEMQKMNMSKTAGKRVEYFLNVSDTMVTFAKGKFKPAIAINGTIPRLRFILLKAIRLLFMCAILCR